MNPLPPLPLIDGALVLDNSTLELLKCPRLMEYQWLRKRTLAQDKAGRNFGSTLHVGWAVRYTECGNNAVTPEVEAKINDAMRLHLEENPQPASDFRNFDHACKVMRVYNEIYKNEGFHVLLDSDGKRLVERSFCLPFGRVRGIDVYYAGKIDLGTEDNNGIWAGPDHKTTFQFGETFNAQMHRDSGQMGYVWALQQHLGPSKTVNGYIIDAVRVRAPSRKNRVSEYTADLNAASPGIAPCDSTDFVRTPFNVTPAAVKTWRRNTLAKIDLVLYLHSTGFMPEFSHNCTNKFGKCDFYDTCSVDEEYRESVLSSTLYEDNDWSPLKKPNNAETKES